MRLTVFDAFLLVSIGTLIIVLLCVRMSEWRNGRRTSLRGWRAQARRGSSPLSDTELALTQGRLQ